MFQKIAPFRVTGARRAPGPVAPTHANDNRINTGCAVAPFRSRPALVCHWRPTESGRLECHWDIESAACGAAEEPDGRRIRRVA
jgi:hypothetical protein